MKKVKNIKFYNFTALAGAYNFSFNAYFFDCYNKLILIDMSNPIQYTSTLCETDKYIVTANGSYTQNGDAHYLRHAFHTGNTYIKPYLTKIGYTWVVQGLNPTSTSGDWIKFEFKTPIVLSDIKILHALNTKCGFNTCDYEVTYDDGSNFTNSYISNGQLSTFSGPSDSYQETYDATFDSIEFSFATLQFSKEIALIETNDENHISNITGKIKSLKCLYSKPENTYIKFLISFDNRNTWNKFNSNNFIIESNTSLQNIFENGIDVDNFDLVQNYLITNNFTGNIDFKIILKTDDVFVAPSITGIYIETE